MSSRRAQKVAEAIREVRHAKVHVSVMGDESQQHLSLRGLQSAAGFLQAKIASQVEMRYTPRLIFLLDQGVKRSIEIAQILREVLPPAEDVQPADAHDDPNLEDGK
jgi:ribosome-binding factor A